MLCARNQIGNVAAEEVEMETNLKS